MDTRHRLLVFFTAFFSLYPLQAQTKYALLIGINTYQPPNTTVRHPRWNKHRPIRSRRTRLHELEGPYL